MMLLRMVSGISKWDGSQVINRKEPYICGDTISDLRTKQNKLSVWKADSPEEINDAIVALALGRNNVQKVCYIILDEADLEKIEIRIEEQMGVVSGLDSKILEQHRDMVDMDYLRLGSLAEYMLHLVRDSKGFVQEGKGCYQCTERNVKSLLETYKNDKRIDTNAVNQQLKEILNW